VARRRCLVVPSIPPKPGWAIAQLANLSLHNAVVGSAFLIHFQKLFLNKVFIRITRLKCKSCARIKLVVKKIE
jgi:hypothetical protein